MFWRGDDYNHGNDDDVIFPGKRTLTIGWKKYPTCSHKHEFDKWVFFSLFVFFS